MMTLEEADEDDGDGDGDDAAVERIGATMGMAEVKIWVLEA